MKTFEVKTIQDHPLYVEAREALHSEELVRFRKFQKSRDLSQEEKKVLKAREFIHSQKWKDALEILENMGVIKSEYLNAEMYAIKTYVYQVLARPEEALWSNQRALFYYELCGDEEGLFRSHYNRAVTLEKFQLYRLMDFHYNEARKFCKEPHQIVHILKAEAFLKCRVQEPHEAVQKIEKALTYEEKLEKTHFDNLKTVASEIYLKAGNRKKAAFILKEVMASKINPERARVLSEIKMLEVIEDNSKMKSPPETIQKNEEWHLRWQILQNIQEGNPQKAKSLWKELSLKYPNLYGKPFSIKDPLEENTAFGLALKKVYQEKEEAPQSIQSLSKIEHLQWLLEQASTPLRKEDLIEKIWGESYDPKFDARFYKLVQRLKKSCPVHNNGGVYSLTVVGSKESA